MSAWRLETLAAMDLRGRTGGRAAAGATTVAGEARGLSGPTFGREATAETAAAEATVA